MAVLITDGFHVPEITGEFVEFEFNTPGVVFWQYGPSGVKAGVTVLTMSTVRVVLSPHCPILGVNVYTDEPILFVVIEAGNQVPSILLLEIAGKMSADELTQKGPT